ncbi:MAG: hypothetical protein LDLANPLL_00075 [Turneriella sp.]|nr:hypothetical protein [Turneriella sp.]
MKSRHVLTVVLLLILGLILFFFLQPCGTPIPSGIENFSNEKINGEKNTTVKKQTGVVIQPKVMPKKDTPVTEAPAKAEPAKKAPLIDDAPPVKLTGSETLPDVGRCATANFPLEAKPYVRSATVTVKLTVDKFGRVRANVPIKVELPRDLAEEKIPEIRKLFIAAGKKAFGAKKCPPYILNGEEVGYVIEVPLLYTH